MRPGKLGNAICVRDRLGGEAGIADHSAIFRSTVKAPNN